MLVNDAESSSSIPLVLERDSSSGENHFECLVRGKSQRVALARLLAIFESRGIQVLNCSFDSNEDGGTFGAIMILKLKENSDSDTLTLVEKLMETRLVSSVEFAPLQGKSYPTFRYPILMYHGERGVIVQPTLLVDSFRTGSKKAIFEAGKEYGRSFTRALSRNRPRDSSLVIQALKITGWGIGKFEEDETGEVTFTLRDPVFGLESEFEDRNKFIVGMLHGIAEETFQVAFAQVTYRFDGKSNSLIVKLKKLD